MEILIALIPTLVPLAAAELERMIRTHPDTTDEQRAKLDEAFRGRDAVDAEWRKRMERRGLTADADGTAGNE